MHGLINSAIQHYLRSTYGKDVWDIIMQEADLGFMSFESMLYYDESVTGQLLKHACNTLHVNLRALLEDLGMHVVCSPEIEPVRRLLRFGGADFVEFLYSLDFLTDRVRLAVPDLTLPELHVVERIAGEYQIHCRSEFAGYGSFLLGAIRAMADDYGALAFITLDTADEGATVVTVEIHDEKFTEGRRFVLSQQ